MTQLELLERLARSARESGEKCVHRFVDLRGDVVESLSYDALEKKSSALGEKLLHSLSAGERALLMFLPGLDFVLAFYACLKAGIIAVPVYPVDFRNEKKTEPARLILKSSKAQYILTTQRFLRSASLFSPLKCQWIATDSLLLANGRQRPKTTTSSPQKSEVAFLQYTSGSTSDPKGVMVGSCNLNHNLCEIQRALATDEQTINCSWLPQYHDMGLIGSILGTAYCGGQGYHMSPFDFMKSPLSWVTLMARVKATHTQAPSFAFGLVAKRAWSKNCFPDLSSLKHVINAAEPLRASDIDSFCATFTTFDSKAMRPTYGLAEHTVFVCSNGSTRFNLDKDKLANEEIVEGDSVTLFGCGRAPKSITVAIVKDNQIVSPFTMGEVHVSSASVALGYWDSEFFPLKFFGGKQYLCTGDLGFLTESNELVICGRLKDLLILRGKNHFPQDLENTAEACGKCRPGCSAAFQEDDSATIVIERKFEIDIPEAIATRVQADIARDHGIQIKVLVVKPRSVPKTTSGKVSRSKAKLLFLRENENILYASESLTQAQEEKPFVPKKQASDEKTPEEKEALFLAIASRVSGQQCSMSTAISALALGSMEGLHFIAEIDDKLQVNLDIEVLFESDMTIADLAYIVFEKNGDPGPRETLLDGAQMFRDNKMHVIARAKIGHSDLDASYFQKKKRKKNLLTIIDNIQVPLVLVLMIILFFALRKKFAYVIIIIFLSQSVSLRLPSCCVLLLARCFISQEKILAENLEILVVQDYAQKKREKRPCLTLVFVDSHEDALCAASAISLYRHIFLPSEDLCVVKATSRPFDLAARLVLKKDMSTTVADALFAKTSAVVFGADDKDLEHFARLAAAADASLVLATHKKHLHAIAAPLHDRRPTDLATQANDTLTHLRARPCWQLI